MSSHGQNNGTALLRDPLIGGSGSQMVEAGGGQCHAVARPLRLGIVACGGYAFQLIKRLRTIPHSGRLVAALSVEPSSVETAYCEAHGVRIVSDLEQLLEFASGRIDAVLNPTPIHVHHATTVKCLKAGIPVWLEKPPVPTVAELNDLASVSECTGQAVHVCFNSLYAFRIQELKSELVAGIYGRVRRVRGVGAWARTTDYFSRSEWAGKLRTNDSWVYDGTINNSMAHLVCNNLYFAASAQHALAEPVSIDGRLWRANPIESEDTSSLRVLTADGVEVLSHLTLCPDEGDIEPLTVIDADLATISLQNFQTVQIDWHDGRSEVREAYKENRIEMLEFLCRQFYSGESALCPLAMTRPFIKTVNVAFEQVLSSHGGSIPSVPSARVERRIHGNSSAAAIRGINTRILESHQTGTLLDLRFA